MKLYIVRHGETDWNKNKMMQGNTDVPLNQNGINQALNISKVLEDRTIDVCYSSPLSRAYETAKLITNNGNIIIDKRLEERELGEFEGKNSSLYDTHYYWDRKINSSLYGVEAANDLIVRVKTFYDELKEKYKDQDLNILIVTHGAIVRSLNFIIEGYDDNTNFALFDVPNCHVFEYKI